MAFYGPKLVVLPDPYRLTWEMWVSTVVGYNPGLNSMDDPNIEWTDFAQRLHEVLPEAPRWEGHETWQEWAATLKGVFHL